LEVSVRSHEGRGIAANFTINYTTVAKAVNSFAAVVRMVYQPVSKTLRMLFIQVHLDPTACSRSAAPWLETQIECTLLPPKLRHPDLKAILTQQKVLAGMCRR
jgi:hypothetical protein